MDNFSNLMMIGECLLDSRRVQLFKKALNKVVNSNSIVVDGGTGSGIMALIAAEAGAKKVYAVEINPDISKWANKNISQNNYSNKVVILNEDMKTLKIPETADVVVMEMMDTGMIAEQQVHAMNQLIDAGIVTENTTVVPNRFETYIELCNYDFDFYGFKMPFIIQARNFGVKKKVKSRLSKKTKIADVNLKVKNKADHAFTGEILVTQDGTINSIIISSKTTLAKGVVTWGTTDMNMPVIVPIDLLKVTKNQLLKFEISYRMGHGFETFNFKIIK